MFEGIHILNTVEVPVEYGWGWNPIAWPFLILGIASFVYLIYKVIKIPKEEYGKVRKTSTAIIIVLSILTIILEGIGIGLNSKYKPTKYITHYSATIGDLVPFTYVMEQYDVVSHTGHIWVLTDRVTEEGVE